MEPLQFKKTGSTWVCQKEDTILYYGDEKTSNGKHEFVVRNAYQEVILCFTFQKSGFKLFGSKKPTSFSFSFEGKEGELQPKERTYDWICGDIKYTFTLGMYNGSLAMVFHDAQDTIAYVTKTTSSIQPLYSAEFCGVWMLLQEVKERVLMEDDKFERALKKAELICV